MVKTAKGSLKLQDHRELVRRAQEAVQHSQDSAKSWKGIPEAERANVGKVIRTLTRNVSPQKAYRMVLDGRKHAEKQAAAKAAQQAAAAKKYQAEERANARGVLADCIRDLSDLHSQLKKVGEGKHLTGDSPEDDVKLLNLYLAEIGRKAEYSLYILGVMETEAEDQGARNGGWFVESHPPHNPIW